MIVIGEVVRFADAADEIAAEVAAFAPARTGTPRGTWVSEPLLPSAPVFRADQLDGFRIAVTSDRRSEDLIAAFERRGADVLHAPTIRMTGADDDETLVRETQAIIDAEPNVLLATTSYGIRRWFESADAAGLGDDLLEVLARSRILVRGPKARGAVRAAGLDDHGMSEHETTTSLVDHVLREPVAGATVAVQLHGFTDPVQLDRLRTAGADVLPVSPYRWTVHEDAERVQRLITAICSGGVDAVTFTSAPASRRSSRSPTPTAASKSCIPPSGAPSSALPSSGDGGTARQRRHPADRPPTGSGWEHSSDCSANISNARRCGSRPQQGHLRFAAARYASTDAARHSAPSPAPLSLGPVRANGATLSRRDLSDAAPGALDDHAVDVAISRLRQALPTPTSCRP